MVYDSGLRWARRRPGPLSDRSEKAAYVDGFLSEGDLMNTGTEDLPGGKSTELLYLNATDQAPFAAPPV